MAQNFQIVRLDKQGNPVVFHPETHIDQVMGIDNLGNLTKYIGPDQPDNENVIWFDTSDESLDYIPNEPIDAIKGSLKDLKKLYDNLDYKIRFDYDCGFFLGKDPSVKVETYLQDSNLIQYEGSWEVKEDDKYFGRKAKTSKNKGDKIKFSFNGEGFSLYGLSSTDTGIANIYVDGEKIEVDTYCYFEAHRSCYCSKTIKEKEDKTFSVVIEVSGKKNSFSTDYFISLSKIEIINGDMVTYVEKAISRQSKEGEEEEEEPSPFSKIVNNDYKTETGVIKIKRGKQDDLTSSDFVLLDGELGYCTDSNNLYIGYNGRKRLVGSSGGGGSNLSGKYVELETEKGDKRYKIGVTEDGDLQIWDSVVDAPLKVPSKENSEKVFAGLIINHVYGGGFRNKNVSCVSHSYIELYNNSTITRNLYGLSIQYKGQAETEWKVLPLRGLIKPKHSFLIRCAQVTDPYNFIIRHHIDKYDMHWDQEISQYGYQIYLTVGTDPCVRENPFNVDGAKTKELGYIDLFGVGGKDKTSSIEAYEESYLNLADVDISAHRIDFRDKNNNATDIEAINMKTAPSEIYKPRSSLYGKWDSHYNKLKLDEFIPMMVNMCFGYDGNTSRTFTWQTKSSNPSFLQYRKAGTSEWTTVETNSRTISHPDTEATIHSVAIHGLTKGNYEYRCGCEGRWTDVYPFEVKVPSASNNDHIHLIQIGDQQGWDEYEYRAWGTIAKLIEKTEPCDFIINVGDISQNGASKAYEWRYYYDKAKSFIYKHPHMSTVGNNDLTINDEGTAKTNPIAFTYYSTVENSEYVSCYSFNYGYCHFICINSNVFNADNEILLEQIRWLKRDVKKDENKNQIWRILYMHEAPYTQVRSSILEPFIDAFVECGIDLVLCGHHHRYTRSKRMGKLGLQPALDQYGNHVATDGENGFYCVMGQAAGYKLKGLTGEAPGYNKWIDTYEKQEIPMYIHWDISPNQIVMHCKQVKNVVPYETNVGKTPVAEEYDLVNGKNFTITKKNRVG